MPNHLTTAMALGLLMAGALTAPITSAQPAIAGDSQRAEPGSRARASGDRLVIPLGKQSSGEPGLLLPDKGSSTSAVESRFGEPLNQSGPVGTPPISRWEYAEFTVYFENDRVLHSVVRHRPTLAP